MAVTAPKPPEPGKDYSKTLGIIEELLGDKDYTGQDLQKEIAPIMQGMSKRASIAAMFGIQDPLAPSMLMNMRLLLRDRQEKMQETRFRQQLRVDVTFKALDFKLRQDREERLKNLENIQTQLAQEQLKAAKTSKAEHAEDRPLERKVKETKAAQSEIDLVTAGQKRDLTASQLRVQAATEQQQIKTIDEQLASAEQINAKTKLDLQNAEMDSEVSVKTHGAMMKVIDNITKDKSMTPEEQLFTLQGLPTLFAEGKAASNPKEILETLKKRTTFAERGLQAEQGRLDLSERRLKSEEDTALISSQMDLLQEALKQATPEESQNVINTYSSVLPEEVWKPVQAAIANQQQPKPESSFDLGTMGPMGVPMTDLVPSILEGQNPFLNKLKGMFTGQQNIDVLNRQQNQNAITP